MKWFQTERYVFEFIRPFRFYRKWEGWPKPEWELQLEREDELEELKRQMAKTDKGTKEIQFEAEQVLDRLRIAAGPDVP